MSVKNFLDQVANLPEDGIGFDSDKWGDLLDKKVPGWKELVADSANWNALAQSKPKEDSDSRDTLMRTIVGVGGLQLANHFIKSKDEDAREGAAWWFRCNLDQFANFSSEGQRLIDDNKILDNLNQIWQHLDPRKREEVINHAWERAIDSWFAQMVGAFELHLHGATRTEINTVLAHEDRYPYWYVWDVGYRFDYYLGRTHPNQPRLSPAASLSRPFVLPRLNFETREPFKTLLAYLQNNNDTASLHHYEVGHAKFLGMTSPIPTVLLPDHAISATIPNDVKKWFKQKQELLAAGKKLPRFPKIEISEDDPPAFKENRRLKQRYEEDGEIGLEGVDVESLLGAYFWDEKRIVIWRKGVELCSRELRSDYGQPKGLPFDDLFLCVLVHELGHWFNAEAKVANGARWDPASLTLRVANREELPAHPDRDTPNASLPVELEGNARSLSSRSYHEAWAQMFAWLYGQEGHPNVLAAFEALEKMQSTPYRAWRQLVSDKSRPDNGPYTLANLRWDQVHILKSLEWSRSLKSAETGHAEPATYADSRFPSTNMMGWLETNLR